MTGDKDRGARGRAGCGSKFAPALRNRRSGLVPEHASGQELFPMNLALEPRACRMLFWALLVVFQICGGPLWGFSVGARQASGGAASPSCQADSVHGISWTNGFDARGNVVSRAGSDGSTQQLAWDALGRLSSVMARHLLFSQFTGNGWSADWGQGRGGATTRSDRGVSA